MAGKKPYSDRRHAGNPTVEAARHHHRTRALRRTTYSVWDPAIRAWVRREAVRR
jgi:hypothetical protein